MSRLKDKVRMNDWKTPESLWQFPCHLLEFTPSAQSWQKTANVASDLSGPLLLSGQPWCPRDLSIYGCRWNKLPSEHTERLSLSLWRDRLNIAVFWCNIVFLQRGAWAHLKENVGRAGGNELITLFGGTGLCSRVATKEYVFKNNTERWKWTFKKKMLSAI